MFGWIPTPVQYKRNVYLGSRALKSAMIPDTLDLRSDLPPVRDQGVQSSCVAMAGAAMKEWQEKHDIGYNLYFSPQFIYNSRTNYPSEGMYLPDLMDILTNKGVCQEYMLPYGSIANPSKITKEMLQDAYNFKIKSYAEIPYGSDISKVKTALADNGPCVISFPVYNTGPDFWNRKYGDQYLGGHAVLIVGYTRNAFIIRNSWGTGWNDGGYTLYPFEEYNVMKHREIWTTVDDKSIYVEPKAEDKQCKCTII